MSLFTGAGGGVLGSKLLGWKTIGYVEINEYCQKIIAQRIKDGFLDEAPVFGDIRAFLSEGFAHSYKGLVDVITAGFPCQPFSHAGKGLGVEDPRNMWPSTIEAIRQVGPTFALLENVPGLLTHEYFGTILGDLAESGFNARWDCFPAASVGAPHIRDRVWILAFSQHTNSDRPGSYREEVNEQGNTEFHDKQIREFGSVGKDVADSDDSRRLEQWGGVTDGKKHETFKRGGWWETEPRVGRVVNGLASRVDRLEALGNGQVPSVVRKAWNLLTKGAKA